VARKTWWLVVDRRSSINARRCRCMSLLLLLLVVLDG